MSSEAIAVLVGAVITALAIGIPFAIAYFRARSEQRDKLRVEKKNRYTKLLEIISENKSNFRTWMDKYERARISEQDLNTLSSSYQEYLRSNLLQSGDPHLKKLVAEKLPLNEQGKHTLDYVELLKIYEEVIVYIGDKIASLEDY